MLGLASMPMISIVPGIAAMKMAAVNRVSEVWGLSFAAAGVEPVLAAGKIGRRGIPSSWHPEFLI